MKTWYRLVKANQKDDRRKHLDEYLSVDQSLLVIQALNYLHGLNAVRQKEDADRLAKKVNEAIAAGEVKGGRYIKIKGCLKAET